MAPTPSDFPQSKEYREFSYQYLDFSYHDGPSTSAPMPRPTRPAARVYGTTRVPDPVEKAAGTAQGKLHEE